MKKLMFLFVIAIFAIFSGCADNSIVESHRVGMSYNDGSGQQFDTLDLSVDPCTAGGISLDKKDSLLNCGWYEWQVSTDAPHWVKFYSFQSDEFYWRYGYIREGNNRVLSAPEGDMIFPIHHLEDCENEVE